MNSIEVRVVERTEPILLQAQPVAVVGSRETTPSNEVSFDESEKDEELSEEQVPIDLEELSRASRKFLEESEGKLAEQQRRNLPGGATYHSFGMEEYKSASLKGLSATIEEMQDGGDSPEQPEKPVSPEKQERAEEGTDEGEVVLDGDMVAQLDGLEAEILTALDDANVALEHASSSEEETVDMATKREVADTQMRGGEVIGSLMEVGGASESRPIRGHDNRDLISSLLSVTTSGLSLYLRLFAYLTF